MLTGFPMTLPYTCKASPGERRIGEPGARWIPSLPLQLLGSRNNFVSFAQKCSLRGQETGMAKRYTLLATSAGRMEVVVRPCRISGSSCGGGATSAASRGGRGPLSGRGPAPSPRQPCTPVRSGPIYACQAGGAGVLADWAASAAVGSWRRLRRLGCVVCPRRRAFGPRTTRLREAMQGAYARVC